MAKSKIEHLIVDTSAFIKNASLQNYGENILTIQEVVDEIQNKRQLRSLVVLPYELSVKDVFQENIKFIIDFSKKTGDYPSLSATDIKVLALTYQIEKEKVGSDHLKTEPHINKVVSLTSCFTDVSKDLAGFYNPKNEVTENENSNEEPEANEKLNDNLEKDSNMNEENCESTIVSQEEIENIVEKLNNLDCNDIENEKLDKILAPLKKSKEKLDEEQIENHESEDEEEDDDDDEGWITPKNFHTIKQDIDFKGSDDKPISVACITSDFAMQNVLKQLGLNVISEDGTMIKDLRTFILRCYACSKTTSIMTKIFCPYCGNKTLKKVAYSLKEDGTQVIHINPRKQISTRGKRFSMPKPQGGKHAINPHLYEDQKFPQQKLTKMAREKNNPLNPDYIAGISPFTMRDTNSKSAMLGLHRHDVKYWMRKNPNEAIKKGKKRK